MITENKTEDTKLAMFERLKEFNQKVRTPYFSVLPAPPEYFFRTGMCLVDKGNREESNELRKIDPNEFHIYELSSSSKGCKIKKKYIFDNSRFIKPDFLKNWFGQYDRISLKDPVYGHHKKYLLKMKYIRLKEEGIKRRIQMYPLQIQEKMSKIK